MALITVLLQKGLGDQEPLNRTGNVKYYMDINNSVKVVYKNIWFCTLPYSLMALGAKQGDNVQLLSMGRDLWVSVGPSLGLEVQDEVQAHPLPAMRGAWD